MARENNASFVPTATNASWMNPVECNAGDVDDLALSGTNFIDWQQVRWAFERAVNYRNRERLKRGKKSGTRRMKGENTENLSGSGTSLSDTPWNQL